MARTAGFGTRGFFGSIRSFQVQANPLYLPLFRTAKPESQVVPGNESVILRTSSNVAIKSSNFKFAGQDLNSAEIRAFAVLLALLRERAGQSQPICLEPCSVGYAHF